MARSTGGSKSVKTTRAIAAEALLDQHGGQIVSVRFIKRDGTERLLNGRAGVKKGVKGVGMAYAPKERGLYPLFDMQKEQFRMANLNTADEIHVGGVTFSYDPTKGWVGSNGAVVEAPKHEVKGRAALFSDFDPRAGF